MNRTIEAPLLLILALSASVVTAQPQALDEERWTTVAEEGRWELEDGQRLDLSTGWKVVRHVESGRERIVPQAFGTASLTIEIVPFSAFQMSSSSVFWTQDIVTGYGERVGSGPVTYAYAPLQVQSGLRVEGIELEYCDESANGALILALSQCPTFDEDGCVGLVAINTGEAAAPGCIFTFKAPGEPLTIDNFSNTYRFVLSDTSNGGGVERLRSVRVYLRRQVSPSPGTATFEDVPTDHLFFQHIEALAASGITAGCGGEDFCPDDPLTRGQMAVFLAKALGLHWPDLNL